MNYSSDSSKKRYKKQNSKKRKVKSKMGLLVFRVILAVVIIGGFALVGIGAGAYMAIIADAPTLSSIFVVSEPYDTIILDSSGKEIDRLNAGENREYADWDQIPQYLKDAAVAIEDKRFYSHDGVDIRGTIRAVVSTLTSDDTQGGSTITQQVIKNRLGYMRNSIETKLQEQYLAVNFEKELTERLGSKEAAKDYILLQYLNIMALGHGQNGVQAAANYYFNKDVSELTLSESCVIIAITQYPNGNSPKTNPDNNHARVVKTLENMLELEMITQEEYDEAINDDVYSRIQEVVVVKDATTNIHSYFVDYLIGEVIADLKAQYGYSTVDARNLAYSGGLTISATMDPNIQAFLDDVYVNETLFPTAEYSIALTYIATTENEITKQQTNYEKSATLSSTEEIDACVESFKDEILGTNDKIVDDYTYWAPQPQSAMVIMDQYNGQIVAIAGGRGEKQADLTFNRATDAVRQPGSSFKIVASYAPALDMGLITPATVYDDAPFTQGSWSPTNAYSGFRGLYTVRQAIVKSSNTVAIRNMRAAGIENCFNYLLRFGFTSLDEVNDKNLSTALGGLTYGVSVLEMTAAYSSFANGGYMNEPVFYSQVLDHDGNVILENTTEPTQVVSKTTAYLLTDMMEDVITSGTGGKAALTVNMPTAGKTGTSNDYQNVTFFGYTPYYTAGIWLGYDTPKGLGSTYRSDSTHLRIWSYVMSAIHENLEYKAFDQPEGLVTAQVCTKSGLLATDTCRNDPRGSAVITETFSAGTVPTTYCDVHMSYTVCPESGMIANEYCPDAVTTVGIVRSHVSTIINTEEISSNTDDAEYNVPAAVLNGSVCTIHSIYNTGSVNTDEPDETDDLLIDENVESNAPETSATTPSESTSNYPELPLLDDPIPSSNPDDSSRPVIVD